MFKNKPIVVKKFFFLSLILSVSIWLLILLFFFWISFSRDQVDSFREKVLSLSSQENEIRTLAREIKSLGESVNDPDQFFIGSDQEDIVKFIEMVELLALDVEVDLDINFVEVLEHDNESLAKDFEFLRINLKTSGSWGNTFYFLSLLESLPYKLVIDQVNFNTFKISSKEQLTEKQWTGTFLFKVAKLKQNIDGDKN